MLGKILGGRYELIEKIGGGGMAIVYKAKCHLLKRYVAVKILRPELVEDEEFVYRFKKESQSAASLSHPNIVNIYDVGKEDEIYYIVMEYVKGKTLKEYIREKKRLDSHEAIRIGLQIGSAIENAHKNNIVHRDIKPQNILLSDDGTAKVADFGIARAVTSSTVTIAGANVIGSVHYFSPEQARGGYVDTKSDLYSLGIVLYEMVTGTVPFEGDSAISVALKHIQEKVKPPGEINPHIPKSLQKIIEKAIEKDPDKRYQNAGELLNDLRRALKEPEGDFVIQNIDSDAPTQVMEKINIPDEKMGDELAEKKHRRNNWAKILLIILPFVVTILAAIFILSRVFSNNFAVNDVEVPNVVNLTEDEARLLLREKKLLLKVRRRINSDDVEQGYIIRQEPEHGLTVKENSYIEVVVSLGPEMLVVPDLKGKSQREAEIMLENEGLSVGKVEYKSSNMPSGTVLEQSVSPQTRVVRGFEISLIVSSGPEGKVVRVGKYTGFDEHIAKQLIVSDNLTVGEVKYEHGDASQGTVIRQYPEEGITVDEYRAIDLWVSLGPVSSYPKDINIDLSEINNKDSVTIVINEIKSNESREVYNKSHMVSEGIIRVRVEGTGTAKYEIFVDGELFHTEIVDFTRKEEAN